MRTARETMESAKGLRGGTVELVTMPSPGIEPLGALDRAVHPALPRDHPRRRCGVHPREVVDKVRQGACELGLLGASGPVSAPGIDVLPLEEQPFVLVGSPDGDFPEGDPVSHAALSDACMIVSPAGSLMRQIVDDLLAGGAEIRIVAEVAHRTSILPLVLQGVGLAVLPSAWAPLARRPAPAPRAWTDRAPADRAGQPDRSLTPAAQAFLAVARAYRPVDHLDGPIRNG